MEENQENNTFAKFTPILVIVNYIARFIWAFPMIGDTQDKVIRCFS
jgi:hypothetical protein